MPPRLLDDALRAVKEGAYDYVAKPFEIEDLRIIIRNALETRRLRRENLELRRTIEGKSRFAEIIGKSPRMVEIFIACSIAYIGIEDLFRVKVGKRRYVIVFLFGLVHGMGFANVLADKLTVESFKRLCESYVKERPRVSSKP